MILGILQTGRVSDEASALYGGYLDMFARLFEPRGFELRLWEVVDGDFPEGPEAADAWLITGSPHGVYEDRPWIAPLEAFIRDIRDAGARSSASASATRSWRRPSADGSRNSQAAGRWGGGLRHRGACNWR
jgi:hypothetical protein